MRINSSGDDGRSYDDVNVSKKRLQYRSTAMSQFRTPGNIARFINGTDLGNSPMVERSPIKTGLGTANPFDYLHVAFTDTTGAFTGLRSRIVAAEHSPFTECSFTTRTVL